MPTPQRKPASSATTAQTPGAGAMAGAVPAHRNKSRSSHHKRPANAGVANSGATRAQITGNTFQLSNDPETRALTVCFDALKPLNAEQRAWLLNSLHSRFMPRGQQRGNFPETVPIGGELETTTQAAGETGSNYAGKTYAGSTGGGSNA